MPPRTPGVWMWDEACEMIDRAERLHRQFFVPAPAQARRCLSPPLDGTVPGGGGTGPSLEGLAALLGEAAPDPQRGADGPNEAMGLVKGHGRSTTVWQSVLILLVFAGLSAPLGLALRDIAYETTVNNVVKANVLTPFQGKRARAGDVFVSFPRDAPINVEVTVLTRERVPGAEAQLQDVLSRKLSGNVQVAMDQVLVNEDRDVERAQMIKLAESSLTAPLRAEVNELKVIAERQRTEAEVRNAAAFPLAAADIDAQAQTAHFFGAQSPDFPVSAWRVSEEGLGRNFPAWQMTVTPPVVEMPLIPFAEGADDLDAGALKIINDCQWALERWNVEAVEVVGYASTAGAVQRFNNQALAYRRAEAVASILRENGIAATPVGEYRAFNQDQEERVLGRQRFQSVLIRPSSP